MASSKHQADPSSKSGPSKTRQTSLMSYIFNTIEDSFESLTTQLEILKSKVMFLAQPSDTSLTSGPPSATTSSTRMVMDAFYGRNMDATDDTVESVTKEVDELTTSRPPSATTSSLRVMMDAFYWTGGSESESSLVSPDDISDSSSLGKIYPNKMFHNTSIRNVEKISLLGEGGFGQVYLIRMLTDDTEQTYALKTMNPTLMTKIQKKRDIIGLRIILERLVLIMSLPCKFIVDIYQHYSSDSGYHFVLEACLGGTLQNLVKNEGKVAEVDAKFYFGCMLEALQYLHANKVMMRDVKLDNVVISHINGYAKLIDFGCAMPVTREQRACSTCGTAQNMAPERLCYTREHDQSCDLWSLGVVLFELITGVHPFKDRRGDMQVTYENIMNADSLLDLLNVRISPSSMNLLRNLWREDVAQRFDCWKASQHCWLRGFDWEALRDQTMVPPYMPKLSGPTDLKYFPKPETTSRSQGRKLWKSAHVSISPASL